MIGLWHYRDIFEAVILAVVGEARLGPGLLDDVEDFAKTFAAFGIGYPIGLVGLRNAAAPDPEDQSAVAQLIDGRSLLGQPQWVAQRQDLNGDADLDAPRARGDRAGDAERRRQHRPPRLEMEFGQPHHIEPQPLGRVDLFHRLVEGLALGPTGKGRKLVKHAEFHGVLSLAPRSAEPSQACRRKLDSISKPISHGNELFTTSVTIARHPSNI